MIYFLAAIVAWLFVSQFTAFGDIEARQDKIDKEIEGIKKALEEEAAKWGAKK